MIPHNETMILETPFHSRCLAACEINLWEDWKGYRSAAAYTSMEQEYFAVRSILNFIFQVLMNTCDSYASFV